MLHRETIPFTKKTHNALCGQIGIFLTLNLVVHIATTSDAAFNDDNVVSKSEVIATAIHDYHQPAVWNFTLKFTFKQHVHTRETAKLCSPNRPVPRTILGQRGKSFSSFSHSTTAANRPTSTLLHSFQFIIT